MCQALHAMPGDPAVNKGHEGPSWSRQSRGDGHTDKQINTQGQRGPAATEDLSEEGAVQHRPVTGRTGCLTVLTMAALWNLLGPSLRILAGFVSGFSIPPGDVQRARTPTPAGLPRGGPGEPHLGSLSGVLGWAPPQGFGFRGGVRPSVYLLHKLPGDSEEWTGLGT